MNDLLARRLVLISLTSSLFLLTSQAAVPRHMPDPTLGSGRGLAGRFVAGPAIVASRASVNPAYGSLPLAFEPNRGQSDPGVRFVAAGAGFGLSLAPGRAVLSLTSSPRPAGSTAQPRAGTGSAIGLRFVGAHVSCPVEGIDRLPGVANYLVGNDPSRWQTAIPTFAGVLYRNLYRGVDLTFHGAGGNLEYDFAISPGADPRSIRLSFRGTMGMTLDRAGNLVLALPDGVLRQLRPTVYQEIDSARHLVAARYVLMRGSTVGLRVGGYDRERPLIVDPVLIYSTYLGGSGSDNGAGAAVDSSGSAYVVGSTSSGNFPTTPGSFDTTINGTSNVFVTKLNAAGSALVYSTYLGGTSVDQGFGIAVDGSGSAYVTGSTLSSDFPTTSGVFQGSTAGLFDAFVTKLNSTGSSLAFSTYLGGAGSDVGRGITTDGPGAAYVTGSTTSTTFPTQSPAQPANAGGQDAFVTKLNTSGTGLGYSTYLGGSLDDEALGIAVRSGAAHVTGYTDSFDFPTTPGALRTTTLGPADAFATKVDATGSSLDYSTYLGGSGDDRGLGIAVNSSGEAFVTGMTQSPDFPTTAGAFQTALSPGFPSDAFVTKLNAAGSGLLYSTYLGGSGDEDTNPVTLPVGIALDSSGSAYVTGFTGSSNFPTQNPIQASTGGALDAFVAKFNPSGSALDYSTYLGGTANDQGFGIAVDSSGAYVTGSTFSANFPTTAGAFDTTLNGGQDAWVAKIGEAATPASISLSPADAVNSVGTTHTVTATVLDGLAQPLAHIMVRFSIMGSVNTSGTCTTNSSGQCSFTYSGPQLPGADVINAFADTNGNGARDGGEPAATPATKAWILPTSTSGQVTGGGQILNATATAKIAFGFTAKSDAKGVKGECSLVDPSANTMVKCTDATSVVISGNQATIFGNATVNGVATTYRIDVTDNAEPGSGTDTFMIQTASGYVAGGVLVAGNIQVHK
jgi:hypothetical protein